MVLTKSKKVRSVVTAAAVAAAAVRAALVRTVMRIVVVIAVHVGIVCIPLSVF